MVKKWLNRAVFKWLTNIRNHEKVCLLQKTHSQGTPDTFAAEVVLRQASWLHMQSAN